MYMLYIFYVTRIHVQGPWLLATALGVLLLLCLHQQDQSQDENELNDEMRYLDPVTAPAEAAQSCSVALQI